MCLLDYPSYAGDHRFFGIVWFALSWVNACPVAVLQFLWACCFAFVRGPSGYLFYPIKPFNVLIASFTGVAIGYFYRLLLAADNFILQLILVYLGL